ncbi:MAG: hypothetical protein HY904_25965 [Deltaproteobacteria bacterium]|nr:hypothetical protein [Deltaproteobacteria bacterium]
MSESDISPKDAKLLWGLAAARCSKPDCRRHLVAHPTAGDPAKVLGEMAHIVAEKPGGPRGDATFPVDQRNAYANLILLCPTHHTEIDGQPLAYPVALLHQWKAEHERWIALELDAQVPRVTFKELEATTSAIASSSSPPTQQLTLTRIPEKMARNGFTQKVRVMLNQALAGAAEVHAFVQHAATYDSEFPERLRDGFLQSYRAGQNAGLLGDTLFLHLVDFACPKSVDLLDRAAALSVLGYLFSVCEVFEP